MNKVAKDLQSETALLQDLQDMILSDERQADFLRRYAYKDSKALKAKAVELLNNLKKIVAAVIAGISVWSATVADNTAYANDTMTYQQSEQYNIAGQSKQANDVINAVMQNNDHGGKNFIVADKANGKLLVVDSNGKLIKEMPALFGKNKGDDNSFGNTPSGRFKLQKYNTVAGTKDRAVFGKDVLDFTDPRTGKPIRAKDGGILAVHRLINKPERHAALKSATANDNYLSHGCINMPTAFYDANLPNLDGAMIYVLPQDGKHALKVGKALADVVNTPAVSYTSASVSKAKPSKTGSVKFDTKQGKFSAPAVKFSLSERADSDFAKAVEAVADGEQTATNEIQLGTTPDVLKMLGVDNANVIIHAKTLQKDMIGKHAVSAEAMKNLPKQLNNPIAVMKSRDTSTNPDGYLVLTELNETVKGKELPVIAALHFKKNDRGVLELINIASAYGRRNIKIAKDLAEGTLYWNKAKGNQFFDNFALSEGSDFDLPALRTSLSDNDYLSAKNIKTEKDLSQFKERAKYALEKGAEQIGVGETPGKDGSAKPSITPPKVTALSQDEVAQTNPHIDTAKLKASLKKSLGKLADSVHLISQEQFQHHPGMEVIRKNGIEGIYHPETGQIFIVADNIKPIPGMSAADRINFVAYHELTHRGLDTKYGEDLRKVLEDVGKNSFIADLAKAISNERRSDAVTINALTANEEALAELNAALKTGNMKHLAERYGVTIPLEYRKGLKATIARFYQQMRDIYRKVLGKPVMSNLAVEKLLEALIKFCLQIHYNQPPLRYSLIH
ncbi:L,D-transpeptidase family protein [Rodentibacter abscessus]